MIRNQSLYLCHLGFLHLPPAKFVRVACAAGFSSVGLRTKRAAPGGIEYNYDPHHADTAHLVSILDETNSSILYIETFDLKRKTDVQDALPMLEFGQAVGATRLSVSGGDTDFEIVAEKLAELVEIAKPHGISVDLEFMPFHCVKSLSDAIEVVCGYGPTGGHILLDMLHIVRSGTAPLEISQMDPELIGSFQICDGPKEKPATAEALIEEARGNRLLPGFGEFPIKEAMRSLPASVPIGAEVPRPSCSASSDLSACSEIYSATINSLSR
jgi:sugar phosphate isomerase/epimerase